MPLSLHPKAQENFDARADALLAIVSQRLEATEPSTGEFLSINGIAVPVEVMWQSLQDSDVRTGVAFPLKNRAIRIEDADFLPIAHLAEQIQRRRELSDAVSVQAVLEVMVCWFKQRIRAETEASFSSFLLSWLGENVTEQTIILPIYRLRLPGALNVSGVEIRQLETSEINGWYEPLLRSDESRLHAERERDEWRQRIGDWAAAFVKVVAERTHALDLAHEKVERVLSALRSFTPAMLIPARRSYCTVYGMQQVRERTAFTIGPEGLPNLSQPSLDGVTVWSLTEDEVRALAAEGLFETLALLELDSPSSFQSDVLRALTVYSRASMEPLGGSKLLYIVSAIETLLLKNDNEPILAAVSRRFAYAVGRNLEERRTIRDRFAAAYGARSDFVHRGQNIDDLLMLGAFMRDAWVFFRGLVFVAGNYASKQDYISAIEDEMLAGPTQPLPQASPPN